AHPLEVVEAAQLPGPVEPHADDVDADAGPTAAVDGQPEAGQPPQPPHLGRGHRFGRGAEPVAGAGLDLDEHHGAGRPVGGHDVQFAMAAAPVPVQHLHPARFQIPDRQLLPQRPDLGATHRCHAATLRAGTDETRRPHPVIHNPDFIHRPDPCRAVIHRGAPRMDAGYGRAVRSVTESRIPVNALLRLLYAHGERPAVRTADTGLGYRELADRVATVAGELGSHCGLVLLRTRNDVSTLVHYLGALAAGHVVLPVNDGGDHTAIVR